MTSSLLSFSTPRDQRSCAKPATSGSEEFANSVLRRWRAKPFALNDGHTLPWLAIGTGTAFYGRDATAAITQALAAGVTHVDGAQAYGNEASIGAALRASGKPRAEVFVTTKLATMAPGASVLDSVTGSLQRMGLEYVDLLLLHVTYSHAGRLGEVWRQMEEAKGAGLVKSIGLSNARIQDLEEVLAVGASIPSVHQLEYHPYVAKVTDPVIEFGKKHGIVNSAYGGLTPIVRLKGGPLDPVLAAIRRRLETTRGAPVSEGQVLLKWLNQKDIVVITTTGKTERLAEYQDTLSVPELTADEITAISEAGYKAHHRVYLRDIEN